MKKGDKYYPCNNCVTKKKHGFIKCPFQRSTMCPVYNACESLSTLMNDEDPAYFNSIPPELITDLLRAHGYSGELRKTEIVVI